jgi:hypothetical protein
VLLIACANVASLLLVRAEERRREVSVRGALGASRSRLVRQFLAENLVVACLGGACGFAFAALGVRALLALAPAELPRLPEVSLDAPVLVFTAGLSLITAVLFGLLPALHGSRADLQETLKEGGRANTAGVRRLRVRQVMVVAQVAMAVVLVVGAGLMLRSFARLLQIDPGFNATNVLTMRLYAPEAYYPEAGDVNRFYERVLNEVRRVTGVRRAGMVRVLPIDTEIGDAGIQVEGYTNAQGSSWGPADWQAASDSYFEAMGMKLAAGRFFTSSDRFDGEQVIVVNEAFVAKYFADGRALDRRVRFAGGQCTMATGRGRREERSPQRAHWRDQSHVLPAPAAMARFNRLCPAGDDAGGEVDCRAALADCTDPRRYRDCRSPFARIQRENDEGSLVHGAGTAAFHDGVAARFRWPRADARAGRHVRCCLIRGRAAQAGDGNPNGAWCGPGIDRMAGPAQRLVQTASGIVLGVALAIGLTRLMAGLMYQTTTRDPLTYLTVALLALIATVSGQLDTRPARGAR